MKRIVSSIFLLLACFLVASAQNVVLKSVNCNPNDLRARQFQRTDADGRQCAMVRVGIVGVTDMVFPEAVGDVKYANGEYVVYVPEGMQKLKYSTESGKIAGEVVFDDFGLDVEEKRVYNVLFDSENHMRVAVFSVQPATAQLTFNGIPISIDKDGMAVAEVPVGEYSYSVEAPGYMPQSGIVQLTEGEISTVTNIVLEQIQHPFNITCQPADAKLFIDGVPYGALSQVQDLKIPDGHHLVRLTAEGYQDYEQEFDVEGQAFPLNVVLNRGEEERIDNGPRIRNVNIKTGYYFSAGINVFDKKNYLGQEISGMVSIASMQHFGAIFALYEGIVFNYTQVDKDLKKDFFEHPADTASVYSLEIPLMAGISIPFGEFSQHLISVLGGAYGKGMMIDVVDPSSKESVGAHGNSTDLFFDYGLRGKVILDISAFSISAEVSYSLAKFKKYPSTKQEEKVGGGLFFGATIGFKL